MDRAAPAALVAQFQGVPTCFNAADLAGGGTLHPSAEPIDPIMRFCCTAVTAYCGLMDTLAAMAILDFIVPSRGRN